MRLDTRMWAKAVMAMPRIEDGEWAALDFVSKWLVLTRFAAIILTLISSAVAGILAYRVENIDVAVWLLLTVALVFAHAANNLLNDYVDFRKGVDRGNYFRAQYGPHPLDRGFMSERALLAYALANLAVALAAGAALVAYRGGLTLPLMLAGLFFLLAYTWPLKYLALGELSILIVWGPLMISGGFYVLTGVWDWGAFAASLPFGIGATLVIFGKHIDKCDMDRAKGVRTLPVVIGEAPSRAVAIALVACQLLLVGGLVAFGGFTPAVLIVVFALPRFFRVMLPMYRRARPETRPEDYRQESWPLWFVGSAFVYTRRFGLLYIAGLAADTAIRRLLAQ